MWKYKMVDIVREGSEPEMLKSIGKTRTFIRNGYSRVETMRNIAGTQCMLRVQFIRAWCRGISIYFTYGLWRSAAAAVLTRLCRPPARSYADNFRPTGNELNWKPRKRQGSGFVIYQTHALPNRFSLSENDLSTKLLLLLLFEQSHRRVEPRSFHHVARTLLSMVWPV